MAPEQRAGGETALAPIADVYALGGMLRWLLTGRLPADATDRKLDPDLTCIIKRALEPATTARYTSAGALADDLERWLARKPLEWARTSLVRRSSLWLRRNPGPTAIVGAMVLLASGALGMWAQNVRNERLREERANAEIVNGLEAEVTRLREKGSGMLKGLIQSLPPGAGMSLDRAFQQAVLFQMMSNSEFLDAGGENRGSL